MQVARRQNFRRGDTLVEVAFAIAIFALVCVFSIGLMNNGVDTAQSSMELTMARNEIDAQSEALRFIQNSYLSEKELVNKTYKPLWDHIKARAVDPSAIDNLNPTPATCDELYQSGSLLTSKGFVINTRKIDPGSVGTTILDYSGSTFKATSLYPRLIFKRSTASGNTSDNSDELSEDNYFDSVQYVEGIAVIAVRGDSSSNPEFYDFHIRTCWYAPGRDNPTTINTIVRLYNPEFSS